MKRYFSSLFLAGWACILLSGIPQAARANDSGEIVIRINTAEFLGRYNYEIAISMTCDVLLKEINPKCPDLRAEISFNMANIHTKNDDKTGALMIETIDGTKTIRQRHYYRGDKVRGRRFCESPEGSSLRYEDKMLDEKRLFYSDSQAFLTELTDSFNNLSTACQEERAG